MTHPLSRAVAERQSLVRQLGKMRAAVKVRLEKTTLVVDPDAGVIFAKADVLWMPLDDYLQVVTVDGTTIEPAGEFLMSVETFDPFHLVTDLF